jgi:histidinol phosphatase-like enzyme
MGKIPNPVDNKITKDLKSAQVTIDMLLMLRDKTKGNLTKTEEKMLEDTISNLQMNYADEVAKTPENLKN